MKTSLTFFALALALFVMQSCGSKSEKNQEEVVATEAPASGAEAGAITPAEKRAKRQKEAAERAEKWRMERDEMAKTSPTYKDADGNIVYTKTEVEPSFPGGETAIRQYIQDNVNYPQEAQDKGIEATVFVDFIVAENGTVRNVEVTDVIGDEDPAFRDEAVRVVSAMPKWTSGKQNGKVVAAKYSLPISFELM